PTGRWLTPATAGSPVAAVAIGAAAVWFVQRDAGGKPPPARAAATESGGLGSAGPTGTDPAGTGGPAPMPSPPGTGAENAPGATASPGDTHEVRRDPKGFTVAVPAGWVREEGGAGVFYRSPDRTALLQVFRVAEPELDPLGAVRGASTYLRTSNPGYQEIRIGAVPGDTDAAELVYEYDNAESGGRRRGIERVFIAGDGAKWAVLAAGPVTAWTATRDHQERALAAFRPSG
ncbi:serine/arginine repetitive matrix protein 2, partial [Streptomyces sp. NPDC059382]|uniref:serine/arginine repetitive matrix protein 2 n=1 Tax=Streptomyces sp. NPDC059382 TaxID=3346816 RepID=UPI0036C9D316